MNGSVGDARMLPPASRFVIPSGHLGAGQPTTMTSSYDSPNSMQQVFYNKEKMNGRSGPLSLSVSLALQCGNMAMLCCESKHTSSTMLPLSDRSVCVLPEATLSKTH
jgi:hypothetical protein